jgi:hypothetical protein
VVFVCSKHHEVLLQKKTKKTGMTNHDEKYQVLLTVTVPSEKWCLVKDTHTLLQDIMPTNSPFFDKKNPQKNN